MAIREGRWRCESCGRENLGHLEKCEGCSADRPPNVRFYLPEDAPVVTDPELLKLARKGPDWTCEHCGTDNPADAQSCQDCGTPRGDSRSRPVRDYRLNEVPRTAEEATAPPPASDFRTYSDQEAQGWRANLSRLGSFDTSLLGNFSPRLVGTGLMLLVLLIVGLLGFLFFRTHEEILTVNGYHWERQIKIEHYTTLTQTGWEGELPADARIINSNQAIHHYNQVVCGSHTEYYQDCHQEVTGYETYVCGERDLGNGFFEDIECERAVYETICDQKSREVTDYCDEPVYRIQYTYQVDRWVYARTETAAGDDHEAYWPDFSLAGNEREIQNGRVESYAVLLINERGKIYSHECQDYQDWLNFNYDKTYKARVNSLGIITGLEPTTDQSSQSFILSRTPMYLGETQLVYTLLA